MRKKLVLGILALIMGVSAAGAAPAARVTATPSNNVFFVDGKEMQLASYKIGGNNYIKLRDLAAAVNGTQRQFDVRWNSAENRIDLMSNTPYTSVGGELKAENLVATTARSTSSDVYCNGEKMDFTAYNVGGNNYFKLRDVYDKFDVGVIYHEGTVTGFEDGDTNKPIWNTAAPGVIISTKVPPEAIKDNRYDYEDDYYTEIYEIIFNPNPEPEKWEPSPEREDVPAVGEYSDWYQEYLDTCGERIVDARIRYETSLSSTAQMNVFGGTKVTVYSLGAMEWNNMNSPLEGTIYKPVPMYSFQIADAGKGYLTIKVPESLYNRMKNDERFFDISAPTTDRCLLLNGNKTRVGSVPVGQYALEHVIIIGFSYTTTK